MANWKKDLQRGKDGETAILALYPALKLSGTLAYDFVDSLGQRFEIKTDYTTYPNIFLELVSNDAKDTPGGAVQSLFKGVDYYIYRFDKTNEIFCFKASNLVWFIMRHGHKYKLKIVPNKSYNTLGYAVPKADLEHLRVNLEDVINEQGGKTL
jgi:hypothetical protein